jgi:sarcosine oxidase
MQHYDAIVLGTGGVGSAALFHLARRGVRALGLDRFPPAHDRGSSHGRTRMIRQAYFEHPSYVPLVLRAYELWHELAECCGNDLFRQTGLAEVGPPDGIVVPGVLASAREHDLDVDELTGREVEAHWPGFRVPDGHVAVFERQAGYLRVEDCIRAHLDEAIESGAVLQTGEEVISWDAERDRVRVVTARDSYSAERLVIATGAWAADVLADLALPLVVLRKPQYWYHAVGPAYRIESGCPAWLFETAEGIFYGFPQIDDLGVKVAEHSGGATVPDPLVLDRGVDLADRSRVEAFIARHLPQVGRPMTHHAVCMYTMTPDANFVIDRHPRWPQVVFAAGLSGHGFKFTNVLGAALADLTLDGVTSLPIDFLQRARPALAPPAGR